MNYENTQKRTHSLRVQQQNDQWPNQSPKEDNAMVENCPRKKYISKRKNKVSQIAINQ